MPFHIRRSKPIEAVRIFAIWKASVEATHDFLSTEDFVAISAQVREYVRATPFRVAVDPDDVPVAFLGMTGAHVDALFVHPSVHGRGVGRLLLDEARARLGLLTVDVNEQNPGAIAFYRKMDFTETERLPLDSDGRPYPILKMAQR